MPVLSADAFAEKDPKVNLEHGKDIMIAATRGSAFAGVMGSDENSIIKTQNETHSKAAIVTMSLLAPLRTLGVRGNENLNGLANKLKRLFMDVKGNVIGEDITLEEMPKMDYKSG